MFNRRPQDLAEAVAGMVSMIIGTMLGLLRARGLRGLLELPAHFRLALELRRMAKDFVALFEAFRNRTLPPLPPAPAPAPQEWQPAPAQPPATPRVAARPAPATRRRQPPVRQSAPCEAAAVGAARPRAPRMPPACRRSGEGGCPRAPIPNHGHRPDPGWPRRAWSKKIAKFTVGPTFAKFITI
jgi:hypothetical protein